LKYNEYSDAIRFLININNKENPMPIYKDKKRNTWYCKFYYTDWHGFRKQKCKRGFTRQRDAKQWEKEFLATMQGTPDMTFHTLYILYMKDLSTRVKQNSVNGKEYVFRLHILPFFGKKPINTITPANIRSWQNTRIEEGYSDSYLHRMHNMLVAIFNYAVTYYNLPENPCRKAGGMGKKTVVVNFWTKKEYECFLSTVRSKQAHITFQVLYYSGIRFGELLALTPKDIDFESNVISITKSLQRLKREDIVASPKTPKSIRDITMPAYVMKELKHYMDTLYEVGESDRIFPFTKSFIGGAMRRGCKESRVKLIRIHDIRHSHASLLIELGFLPLLIAERLGHEKVETTLSTYAHLYPNKHSEIAKKLESLHKNSISVSQ
jgi:integrase